MATDKPLDAGLYVVATPIGNLGDMTSRGLDVLRRADRILCEDTRISRRLLDAYEIDTRLIAYHDHNGAEMRPKVLGWLSADERIALISDAGTPLISDPGYKLVDACLDAGHRVLPVPGASAVVAALSAAGLPTDRFTFLGFTPQKSQARTAWFKSLAHRTETLVFYESPKRLKASLSDAFKALGERRCSVGRELTKKFEEIRRDDLSALIKHYQGLETPKGEIVVVLEGADPDGRGGPMNLQLEDFYAHVAHVMPIKSAADLAVKLYGGARRAHYHALMALRETDEHDTV